MAGYNQEEPGIYFLIVVSIGHSPCLPTAFGWRDCGGWFGCSGLHIGLLVNHGQDLSLLLGQFSRNGGVLDAGADTGGKICTVSLSQ